jgi:hypothetical protein
MEVHPEVFSPAPPLPSKAPHGNFLMDIGRNIYEWWTRK